MLICKMKNFASIRNKNLCEIFRDRFERSPLKILAWNDKILRKYLLFPKSRNSHRKTLEITLVNQKRLEEFLKQYSEGSCKNEVPKINRKAIFLLDTPEIRRNISWLVKITHNDFFMPLYKQKFVTKGDEFEHFQHQLLQPNNFFENRISKKSDFQLELKGIKDIFFDNNPKEMLVENFSLLPEIKKNIFCPQRNRVFKRNLGFHAVLKKILSDLKLNKVSHVTKVVFKVRHTRSAPAFLKYSPFCSKFRSKSTKHQVLLLNSEYFEKFRKIHAKISARDNKVDVLRTYFELAMDEGNKISGKFEQAFINRHIIKKNVNSNKKKDFILMDFGYLKKIEDAFLGNSCGKKSSENLILFSSDIPKFYFDVLKRNMDIFKENRRNFRKLLIVNEDIFKIPQSKNNKSIIESHNKNEVLYLNSPIFKELGRKTIQSIVFKRQYSINNNNLTKETEPITRSRQFSGMNKQYCEIPLQNLIKAVAEKKQKEYVTRSEMNLKVFNETKGILKNIKILEFPPPGKLIRDETVDRRKVQELQENKENSVLQTKPHEVAEPTNNEGTNPEIFRGDSLRGKLHIKNELKHFERMKEQKSQVFKNEISSSSSDQIHSKEVGSLQAKLNKAAVKQNDERTVPEIFRGDNLREKLHTNNELKHSDAVQQNNEGTVPEIFRGDNLKEKPHINNELLLKYSENKERMKEQKSEVLNNELSSFGCNQFNSKELCSLQEKLNKVAVQQNNEWTVSEIFRGDNLKEKLHINNELLVKHSENEEGVEEQKSKVLNNEISSSRCDQIDSKEVSRSQAKPNKVASKVKQINERIAPEIFRGESLKEILDINNKLEHSENKKGMKEQDTELLNNEISFNSNENDALLKRGINYQKDSVNTSTRRITLSSDLKRNNEHPKKEKKKITGKISSKDFQILGIPSQVLDAFYNNARKKQDISKNKRPLSEPNKNSKNVEMKRYTNIHKPAQSLKKGEDREKRKDCFEKKSKTVSNYTGIHGPVKKQQTTDDISSNTKRIFKENKQLVCNKSSNIGKTLGPKENFLDIQIQSATLQVNNISRSGNENSKPAEKSLDIISTGKESIRGSDGENSVNLFFEPNDSKKNEISAKVKESLNEKEIPPKDISTQKEDLKIKTKIPKIIKSDGNPRINAISSKSETALKKSRAFKNKTSFHENKTSENNKETRPYIVKSSASSFKKDKKTLPNLKTNKKEEEKLLNKKSMATFSHADRRNTASSAEKSLLLKGPNEDFIVNIKKLKKQEQLGCFEKKSLIRKEKTFLVDEINHEINTSGLIETIIARLNTVTDKRLNSVNERSSKRVEKEESNVEDEIETRLIVEELLYPSSSKTGESSTKKTERVNVKEEKIVPVVNSSLIKSPTGDDKISVQHTEEEKNNEDKEVITKYTKTVTTEGSTDKLSDLLLIEYKKSEKFEIYNQIEPFSCEIHEELSKNDSPNRKKTKSKISSNQNDDKNTETALFPDEISDNLEKLTTKEKEGSTIIPKPEESVISNEKEASFQCLKINDENSSTKSNLNMPTFLENTENVCGITKSAVENKGKTTEKCQNDSSDYTKKLASKQQGDSTIPKPEESKISNEKKVSCQCLNINEENASTNSNLDMPTSLENIENVSGITKSAAGNKRKISEKCQNDSSNCQKKLATKEREGHIIPKPEKFKISNEKVSSQCSQIIDENSSTNSNLKMPTFLENTENISTIPKSAVENEVKMTAKCQNDLSESYDNVIILKSPDEDFRRTLGSREGITKSFLEFIQSKMVNFADNRSKSRLGSKNLNSIMSRKQVMRKLKELNVFIRRSYEKLAHIRSSRLCEAHQEESGKSGKIENTTTNSTIRESLDKSNQVKLKKCYDGNVTAVESAIEGKITPKIRSFTVKQASVREKKSKNKRKIEIPYNDQMITKNNNSFINLKKKSIGSMFADTVTSALASCGGVDNILKKYSDSKCSVTSSTMTNDNGDFHRIIIENKDKIKNNTDIAIGTETETNKTDGKLNATLALKVQIDKNENDDVIIEDKRKLCNGAALVTFEKSGIDNSHSQTLIVPCLISENKKEEESGEITNFEEPKKFLELQLKISNIEVFCDALNSDEEQKKKTAETSLDVTVGDIIGKRDEVDKHEGSTIPSPEISSIIGKEDLGEEESTYETATEKIIKSVNNSAQSLKTILSDSRSTQIISEIPKTPSNFQLLSLGLRKSGLTKNDLCLDLANTKNEEQLRCAKKADLIQTSYNSHKIQNEICANDCTNNSKQDTNEVIFDESKIDCKEQAALLSTGKENSKLENVPLKTKRDNNEHIKRAKNEDMITIKSKDGKTTDSKNESSKKLSFSEQDGGEGSSNSPEIFLTPLSSITVFEESFEDFGHSKHPTDKNNDSTLILNVSKLNKLSVDQTRVNKKIKKDTLCKKETVVDNNAISTANYKLKNCLTCRIGLEKGTVFGKPKYDPNKIEEQVETRIKQIDNEYIIPNIESDVQKYFNNKSPQSTTNEQLEEAFASLEKMGSSIVKNTTARHNIDGSTCGTTGSVNNLRRKFTTGTENSGTYKFIESMNSKVKGQRKTFDEMFRLCEGNISRRGDGNDNVTIERKTPTNSERMRKKIKKDSVYHDIVRKSETIEDKQDIKEKLSSDNRQMEHEIKLETKKRIEDFDKSREKNVETLKTSSRLSENNFLNSEKTEYVYEEVERRAGENEILLKLGTEAEENKDTISTDIMIEINRKEKNESPTKNKILKKFSELTDIENPSILNLRKNLKFDMNRKRLLKDLSNNKVSKKSTSGSISKKEMKKMILKLSPTKELNNYNVSPDKNELTSYLKHHFLKNRRKIIDFAARNQYVAFLLDLKSSNKEARRWWKQIKNEGLTSEVSGVTTKNNIKSKESSNNDGTVVKSMEFKRERQIIRDLKNVLGKDEKSTSEKIRSGSNIDKLTKKTSLQSETENLMTKSRKLRSYPKLKSQIFDKSKGNSGKRNLSIQHKDPAIPEEPQLPIPHTLMRYLENIDLLNRTNRKIEEYTPKNYEEEYNKSIEDIVRNAKEKFEDSIKFKKDDWIFKETLLFKPYCEPDETQTMLKKKSSELDISTNQHKQTESFGTKHNNIRAKNLSTNSEKKIEQKTAIIFPGRKPIKISLNSSTPRSKDVQGTNPLKSLSDVLSSCNGPYVFSYTENDNKEIKYKKQKKKILDLSKIDINSSVYLDNKKSTINNDKVVMPLQRKSVNFQQTSLKKSGSPFKEGISMKEKPKNINENIEKITENEKMGVLAERVPERHVLKIKSFSDFAKENPELLKKIKHKTSPAIKMNNVENGEDSPVKKFEYRFHDFRRREDDPKHSKYSMKLAEQKKRNILTKFKGLIQSRKNVYEKMSGTVEYHQTKSGEVPPPILKHMNCFKTLQRSGKANIAVRVTPDDVKSHFLKNKDMSKVVRSKEVKINEDDLSTLIQEHPKTPEVAEKTNQSCSKEVNVIHIPWKSK